MAGEYSTSTVLVVDDEGANRYSVSKTLQKVGYIVTEAANGQDALDLMQHKEFDVVLADIRMPVIDGITLLRLIKEEKPDAVVVLMTGYASLGSAVEALRLGAHDYLIKPSSSQDIREAVHRGVERARNLKRRRRLLETIRSDFVELVKADEGIAQGTVPPTQVWSDQVYEPEDEESSPEPQDENPPAGMRIGMLTVFPGRYQIAIEDRPIDLTPTEFDMLLYLAANPGRVVACSELVQEVRGYVVDELEAREVIRPHISNLRKKIKHAGQPEDLITNIRGAGYRLVLNASGD
jgi:DNA-binding response OmpR family regulator